MSNLDERLWPGLFLPGENEKGVGQGRKKKIRKWVRKKTSFTQVGCYLLSREDQGHLICTALTFFPLPQTLCIIIIHPFILPHVSKEDVFFYFAKVHPSTWTIDLIPSHLFQTIARSIISKLFRICNRPSLVACSPSADSGGMDLSPCSAT